VIADRMSASDHKQKSSHHPAAKALQPKSSDGVRVEMSTRFVLPWRRLIVLYRTQSKSVRVPERLVIHQGRCPLRSQGDAFGARPEMT
jgi:hypothetical protein